MYSPADHVQFGGDHYKDGGHLQHWNMAAANGLGYFESAATKYVTRWRKKAGLLDLEKAGHYHDKLLELARIGAACPAQTHKAHIDLGLGDGLRRRILDRADMMEYAEANGLNELERTYCAMMVDWSDSADIHKLEDARAILTALQERANADAQEGRAFT